MKRGSEILVGWVVVAFLLDTIIVPHSIPSNGFEVLCDRLTVISFPLGAWFYARHSGRVSVVICYGLIAGTFSIFGPLSFFYDARGMAREITAGWKFAIVGVPMLMTLICVALFALRRFLDGKDDPK
jgi:hypothetical protein